MKKPPDATLTISADYRQFIGELKSPVTSARISTATPLRPTATPFPASADNPFSIAKHPISTALFRKSTVFEFHLTAKTRFPTA